MPEYAATTAPELPPLPVNGVLLRDPAAGEWLLFLDPVAVCVARGLDEVADVLDEVEARTARDGVHAAGFVSYEAGPAFDSAIQCRADESGFPLAWFGIYSDPARVNPPPHAAGGGPRPMQWNASVSPAEYREAVAAVRALIAAGDTYQVNYSFRLRAAMASRPHALFAAMAAAHGDGFAAMLRIPGWSVCSASPELFFSLDGDRLVSRPMKGTARRGLWRAEDLRLARELRASPKERAENVMVTDMVRNDLGRIAEAGSVTVEGLFSVEQYPTVWQMTSTVSCHTAASIAGIFGALFPPASVTGAPKVRTTGIIADLECSPRRIYTGAIGHVAPGRSAQFSVAIRTVLVDERRGDAEYGVGGGIVWDSVDSAELGECMEKARVLDAALPEFSLIEAFRWTPEGGFDLLRRHMERLADSAAFFGWRLDAERVLARLRAAEAGFPPAGLKVRLAVACDGTLELTAEAIAHAAPGRRVGVARIPVDSKDVFLYHKTTRRAVYDAARAAMPGCDDVILWNERGEATESCRANLVAELDGCLVTPPVACGLLPGTMRAEMLARGEIVEREIPVADLARCTRMFLANSVRGMWEMELDPDARRFLLESRPGPARNRS